MLSDEEHGSLRRVLSLPPVRTHVAAQSGAEEYERRPSGRVRIGSQAGDGDRLAPGLGKTSELRQRSRER